MIYGEVFVKNTKTEVWNNVLSLHRVQYEGCANRWTFHPAALVKVCTFHVGDLVTIINDAAKVQVNIGKDFQLFHYVNFLYPFP